MKVFFWIASRSSGERKEKNFAKRIALILVHGRNVDSVIVMCCFEANWKAAQLEGENVFGPALSLIDTIFDAFETIVE